MNTHLKSAGTRYSTSRWAVLLGLLLVVNGLLLFPAHSRLAGELGQVHHRIWEVESKLHELQEIDSNRDKFVGRIEFLESRIAGMRRTLPAHGEGSKLAEVLTEIAKRAGLRTSSFLPMGPIAGINVVRTQVGFVIEGTPDQLVQFLDEVRLHSRLLLG